MDITHYRAKHFLTLIACGPTDLQFGDHCFDKTPQVSFANWRYFLSEVHQRRFSQTTTLLSVVGKLSIFEMSGEFTFACDVHMCQ